VLHPITGPECNAKLCIRAPRNIFQLPGMGDSSSEKDLQKHMGNLALNGSSPLSPLRLHHPKPFFHSSNIELNSLVEWTALQNLPTVHFKVLSPRKPPTFPIRIPTIGLPLPSTADPSAPKEHLLRIYTDKSHHLDVPVVPLVIIEEPILLPDQ